MAPSLSSRPLYIRPIYENKIDNCLEQRKLLIQRESRNQSPKIQIIKEMKEKEEWLLHGSHGNNDDCQDNNSVSFIQNDEKKITNDANSYVDIGGYDDMMDWISSCLVSVS